MALVAEIIGSAPAARGAAGGGRAAVDFAVAGLPAGIAASGSATGVTATGAGASGSAGSGADLTSIAGADAAATDSPALCANEGVERAMTAAIAAMAGRTFLFWVITKGQQMAEHNGYEQSTGRNCGGIAVMEVAMAER